MATIRPEDITNIIGSPIENARRYWPKIVAELAAQGKNTAAFQVALLATIGVECGIFKPVREYGPTVYFLKYDGRKDLGNDKRGDGYTYRGGGFVQLTGKLNYRVCGSAIGVDLLNHPEKIVEDEPSIKSLIWFATTHGLDVWAARAFNKADEYEEEFCWRKIRRLVNGGYNGYDKFRKFAAKFEEIARRPS